MSSEPTTIRFKSRYMLWLIMGGLLVALVLPFLPIPGTTRAETPNNTEDRGSSEQAGPQFSDHLKLSPATCDKVPYGTRDTARITPVHPENEHFATPPNPAGPTLVDLGLYVIALTNIDPLANTFTIEGYVDLIWCDPREGYDPTDLGWHEKVFLEAEAEEELLKIWSPHITFPHQEGPRETESLEIQVFPDGTIEYEERFDVVLAANYDFAKFPLDRQTLAIEIESLAWSEDYLIFHQEADLVGFSDEFSLAEWQIESMETELLTRQEIRDDQPFSEFMMTIEVTRKPGFYIWKIFMPMVLIVALSWAVFWMVETDIHDRIQISFIGILTVVAYQFVVGDSLPHIPYLTFMDTAVFFSFSIMVLSILQNIVVHILRLEDKKEQALRIDRLCRRIFPSVYLLGLIAIAAFFLL